MMNTWRSRSMPLSCRWRIINKKYGGATFVEHLQFYFIVVFEPDEESSLAYKNIDFVLGILIIGEYLYNDQIFQFGQYLSLLLTHRFIQIFIHEIFILEEWFCIYVVNTYIAMCSLISITFIIHQIRKGFNRISILDNSSYIIKSGKLQPSKLDYHFPPPLNRNN